MLIRFVVKNFLSFRDETEFNMLTGNLKLHKDHIYKFGKVNLLKSAAIYGANGSGKSNLIKAISYLQDVVVDGNIEKNEGPTKFKLDPVCTNKPTSFEIEFGINGRLYSYGISLQKNVIIEEWLYKLGITKGDKLIFERKSNKKNKTSLTLNEKYIKSEKDKLLVSIYEDEILKHNQPFITEVHGKKRYKEIVEAYSWFKYNLHIIYPRSKPTNLIEGFTDSDSFRKLINDIFASFDTGVQELAATTILLDKFLGEEDKEIKEELLEELNENPKQKIYLKSQSDSEELLIMLEEGKPVVKKLITKHKGKGGKLIDFGLEEESDGTQRLLDLIPALSKVLFLQQVILIDEIDQSVHPALLKVFIKKFLENSNTKGQIIFTTHESNLLDFNLFRQDEIWFAEKDKSGASYFYSLSDYKPRYDLDVRKGYLQGRFGAIPFLGNLEDLNWGEYAKEK